MDEVEKELDKFISFDGTNEHFSEKPWQQYTTEWAKKYLREHPECESIEQNSDMNVETKWEPVDEYYGIFTFGYSILLGKMLEHPDGWQNSKVTREEL